MRISFSLLALSPRSLSVECKTFDYFVLSNLYVNTKINLRASRHLIPRLRGKTTTELAHYAFPWSNQSPRKERYSEKSLFFFSGKRQEHLSASIQSYEAAIRHYLIYLSLDQWPLCSHLLYGRAPIYTAVKYFNSFTSWYSLSVHLLSFFKSAIPLYIISHDIFTLFIIISCYFLLNIYIHLYYIPLLFIFFTYLRVILLYTLYLLGNTYTWTWVRVSYC